MSTDKENHKSEEMKVEEKGDTKPDIKKAEANDIEKEVKDDDNGDKSDNESEPEPEKVKKETPRKSGSKVKETKKEEKSDEEDENDEEKDGDEEEEEEDEDDGEKKKKADKDVPLLDQPLQVSGARERKKVERFSVDKSELKEMTAIDIPEGKGVALGNIGIIENNISKHKAEDLKKFHHVLFGRPGKATLIKKNIRKFNGFDFDKDTEQYEKKKASVSKIEIKNLKEMLGIVDLSKSGSREELAARLLDFLMEPKGSGAAPPAVSKGGLTKGGRPKRSAAAKANNKGYSESDGDDEEDRAPRSRRSKGKRPNLKDESSSEEDEKVKNADDNDDKGSDVDIPPEDDTPSSDDSDGPKSKKKRAPPPKASAKKSKKKSTPAKKEKPSSKKRKAESDEDDEEEEEEENESSEDDQPLVKKAKTPPTDDDIKTYVKEILEGANLEEITMKTVCKQVYSHYPEFDLAHKKDFIKTTVKSLIST